LSALLAVPKLIFVLITMSQRRQENLRMALPMTVSEVPPP
jgi:hypothetical protein